jgi:broad specificity phosphatase PhoE
MQAKLSTWWNTNVQKDFVVTIVRHGTSNANEKQHCGKNIIDKWSRWFMLDPPLSRRGIRNSEKYGVSHAHDERDTYICCSTLIRAMMTALLMFPTHVVHMQPWVKEEGGTVDNMPNVSFEKQIEEIDEALGETSKPRHQRQSARLDFSHVQDSWWANRMSNPTAFWSMLPKQDAFRAFLESTSQPRVILVAHGKMFRKQFLEPNATSMECRDNDTTSASCFYKVHPNHRMLNNEMWDRRYVWNPSEHIVAPVQHSPWRQSFEGFEIGHCDDGADQDEQ